MDLKFYWKTRFRREMNAENRLKSAEIISEVLVKRIEAFGVHSSKLW
jgi:hypothetical protein